MRRMWTKRTKKVSHQSGGSHHAAEPLRPWKDQTFSDVQAAELGRIAAEVWRLGRRIEAAPGTNARIIDSHQRLVTGLMELGVRIEDPIGQRFVDGTNADILDLPDSSDPSKDVLIVSDVLRPAIFLNERCVVQPQIVLAKADQADGDAHAAQHD